MEGEIVNRVAKSPLITFDLEDHYPKGERKLLDIAQWLYEGLILREKEFRTQVDLHNWSDYEDSYVALYCSTDAIVPAWAFMLVASRLAPHARKVHIGSLNELETALYQDILNDLDVSPFIDKPVIIKGCSHRPVPENAYIMALAKIQEVAKNVMYGEACSSVPLYRKK